MGVMPTHIISSVAQRTQALQSMSKTMGCVNLPHDDISAKTFSASSPVALLPSTKADAACPIRHGVLGITRICTQALSCCVMHGTASTRGAAAKVASIGKGVRDLIIGD